MTRSHDPTAHLEFSQGCTLAWTSWRTTSGTSYLASLPPGLDWMTVTVPFLSVADILLSYGVQKPIHYIRDSQACSRGDISFWLCVRTFMHLN